jgi:hypothetical protein
MTADFWNFIYLNLATVHLLFSAPFRGDPRASIISPHEQVLPYLCILSFGPRLSIGGRCLL